MDLKKEIERIKEGYTVETWEEDGHDECGSLYWVWCKNGWSGRSWELDSVLKKDIKYLKNKYYKEINSNCKNKQKTNNTNTSSVKCSNISTN